jgi:hypothetical protein
MPFSTTSRKSSLDFADFNIGTIDVLRSARGRLVDPRRELAIALAKPFARADTEQWRKNMIEVQATIRAIDETLKDEEGLASK